MDEWSLVGFGYGEGIAPDAFRSMTKYETSPITISSAAEALERVISEAGASLPTRDAVDLRIVEDVGHGTGAIIDSPEDVGGYPALSKGIPLVDSDHDGMPDEWELEMGLDPEDPSDGNGDMDNDGYTNIEEYLHFLSNLMPIP
jgi:hypothetical protein